jgi:hypothetical protein
MLADRISTPVSTGQSKTLAPARVKWVLIALAGVIVLAALLIVFRPQPVPAGSTNEVNPAQASAVQATWGIRILQVALTGNGGLVDLRYQVIDPDKAIGVHDPENLPVLIDEATGRVIDRAALHGAHNLTRSYRSGGTYFLLYQNTAGVLKQGSRVTVQIGEVKLEHVVVIQ